MTRLGARGEGKLGCILWLLVAGAAVVVTVKAVPVKLADAEFTHFIEDLAERSGRATDETVRNRILNKAKELEIPLETKNLKVEKSTSRVRIRWRYTVTLDFGFYQYDWVFDHELDRPIFIV